MRQRQQNPFPIMMGLAILFATSTSFAGKQQCDSWGWRCCTQSSKGCQPNGISTSEEVIGPDSGRAQALKDAARYCADQRSSFDQSDLSGPDRCNNNDAGDSDTRDADYRRPPDSADGGDDSDGGGPPPASWHPHKSGK